MKINAIGAAQVLHRLRIRGAEEIEDRAGAPREDFCHRSCRELIVRDNQVRLKPADHLAAKDR